MVVGTVLNLINQGEVLFGAPSIDWTKIILTYFVPYAVATYAPFHIGYCDLKVARNVMT